jgi:hypothetical protein
VVLGIFLVGLGVLFLLDNLNLIETREFIGRFWPVLVIAWGAAKLLFGRGGEKLLGGLAAFFGIILLGNRLAGWDINVVSVFWPLLLIALGVSMLTRSRGSQPVFPAPPGPPPMPGFEAPDSGASSDTQTDTRAQPDTAAQVKEFVVMGGVERRNVSQAFQGGDVTAIMGSVELDLRDCRMAGNEIRVTVVVMMGEASFRIPRDWLVDSRITAVAAGVDDRSEPPVAAAPKRFVIQGSAFLGNVEIRN